MPSDSAVEGFLRTFFGHGNRFLLEKIRAANPERGMGRIQAWIAPLLERGPGPTVLPRWRDGKDVEWYGLAFEERHLRILAEELNAFVGPTYSTFRSQRGDFDPLDPIDAAVLALTHGRALRFRGPPTEQGAQRAWEALHLMRHVTRRRIERTAELPVPTGRMLRDFYMAIAAGSRKSAEQHLARLEAEHLLDRRNVQFLRIQLLAAVGAWHEVLRVAELSVLLAERRPRAVTQALLEAVYQTELASFERRQDPAGAAEHFRARVFPLYGSLFASRAALRGAAVAKAFMLLAVAGPRPAPELREQLIVGVDELQAEDADYLRALAAELPVPAPAPAPDADALERAGQSLLRGDYDAAYPLALGAEPSRERTRILFDCAYQLETLEVEQAALSAFEALSGEDKEAFLKPRWNREFWQSLVGSPAEPAVPVPLPPTDWLAWLRRLNDEGPWHRAEEIARQGAAEWGLDPWTSAAAEIRTELERTRTAAADEVLQNALPHLLTSLRRDPEWPRAAFREVYAALAWVLAVSSHGGEEDLILFNDLAEALLKFGLGPEPYGDLVDLATTLWEDASVTMIGEGLNCLDLLVTYPCPATAERDRFFQVMTAAFQRNFRRAESDDWVFFRMLCEDLGQVPTYEAIAAPAPGAQVAAKVTSPFAALSGKSVALYTLTESAAKRTSEILKEFCPTVKVELCHDFVCTDRLRAFAKNVDIFVVATRSAQHAATGCIDDNRPKALPLLRPGGKGSASMLAALREFLSSAAPGQAV